MEEALKKYIGCEYEITFIGEDGDFETGKLVSVENDVVVLEVPSAKKNDDTVTAVILNLKEIRYVRIENLRALR